MLHDVQAKKKLLGTFFSHSKLTLYTESCFELSESCEWLQALLKILSQYEKKQVRKINFLQYNVCFLVWPFFLLYVWKCHLKDIRVFFK